MKSIKYSLMGLAILAMGLTGCQDSYDAPDLQTPKATMQPNTTLAEIKSLIAEQYDGENDVCIKVEQKENGENYIVHGRVISSDASGNIYQNLVIQDETAALTLSIREGSMWTSYRVGQDVVLDITGLYMGTYSGLYQIGWLDQYNGGPSMTFMSWFMFKDHNEMNGLPNQDFQYIPINSEWPSANPYCFVTTIAELNSISSTTEMGRNVMSQLVEIQNVSFVDGGKDTYAEYQESNERRYIQDAYGNQIALNNSGYASFHNEILPVGIGTVRGILGFYQDSWQLTIRGLEDVIFDEKGTQRDPYTVSEALEMNNNGRTAWTKGYIVGSVMAGVSEVTSSSDIIFGADAETPNNVIIAQTPDEKDYSKCMIVSLPAGTLFRQYANLVDNPDMYGKVLSVNGTYAEFMGMAGIVGNGGGLSDFEIEGVNLGGEYGVGSESNPYTVKYLLDNNTPATNVWVEGYIVGFVTGTDYNEGAVFGPYENQGNYNGANVIISSSPDGATLENSVPVSVDRTKVGLRNNPENLGKKIKLLGNTGMFLNTFGMDATTSFVLE